MHEHIAKYKIGSTLFLSNCKDQDYLYIYESIDDCLKARKILPHRLTSDCHCKTVEEIETKLTPFSYANHFWELLEGQEVKIKSIYENEKEYARVLLEYGASLSKGDKRWYHIYLGANALKNGKGKNFTKTQLKVAQKIHDNGVDDAQYSKLFDYLQNIVNN